MRRAIVSMIDRVYLYNGLEVCLFKRSLNSAISGVGQVGRTAAFPRKFWKCFMTPLGLMPYIRFTIITALSLVYLSGKSLSRNLRCNIRGKNGAIVKS